MAAGSVKTLAESGNLRSIPSKYVFHRDPTDTAAAELEDSIPVIDLSHLTSNDPRQKAKALDNLDKACQEWGFFMLVNHGVPKELIGGVIEAMIEFFDMSAADKPEFEPRNVLSPIRYGTSFNAATDSIFSWRDFLKVFVHPTFNSPHKPESLRRLLHEYSERTREVVHKLLKGIFECLKLEETEIDDALGMKSSLQIFVANYYPPCPDPDKAMGMLPHSDHGLFTLLIHNGVDGLQIQHHGRWINIFSLPNSILVNTGDHLEIFSNGKYKSVLHRAMVNAKKTRISIAMANGPSPNTIVSPAPRLVDAQRGLPNYGAMKYKDYLLAQQSGKLDGKSMLQQLHLQNQPTSL